MGSSKKLTTIKLLKTQRSKMMLDIVILIHQATVLSEEILRVLMN